MSNSSVENEPNSKPANKILIVITAVLLIFSALEYWAIVTWNGVANADKVTAILGIIGAYGIGIGFLKRMKDLGDHVKQMLGELVSPNAGLYIASNFTYLGVVCSLLAVGLNSRKTRYPPAIVYLISSLTLIVIGLGVFIYVFFHLLIVIPIAYPAVLVASAIVDAFENASGDSVFTITGGDAEQHMHAEVGNDTKKTSGNTTVISLKSFVSHDRVAATGFIMGLPAAVLGLIGKIVIPFF